VAVEGHDHVADEQPAQFGRAVARQLGNQQSRRPAPAGALALDHFHTRPEPWEKAPGQLVTEADLAVDRLLHGILIGARPDDGWLSEERPDDGSRHRRRRVWVVDPIDGTRAFVAGKGNEFLVADYSQIELRVLAHMSGDPFLIEAFQAGLDIHTATASRVWGVPTDEVTANQRRTAKMINFGLLYGMEAFGLADRLGISRDEAKEHIDAYFSQFTDVKEYMQSVVTLARNQGYTTTLFGRRRYLPELKSDNFRIRQMGERMALNAPVQGTAADIIKAAMIELDATLREEKLATMLLLQIHDELILEVPEQEKVVAEKLVIETMEGVTGLDVPLKVDIAWGQDLASVKM